MDDNNDITRKKLQLLFDEETRKLDLFLFFFFLNILIKNKNKNKRMAFISRQDFDCHLRTNFEYHI